MDSAQTYINPEFHPPEKVNRWDYFTSKQKWGKIALLIVLILGLYLLKTEWFDKPTLVTVLAEGKIKVKPEVAKLTIGVTNLSTASAQAVTGNNLKIKTLKATLKTYGVNEKDITVGSFRVNNIPGSTGQEVYQGINSINLTLIDLSKVDELLKTLKSQNYQNIAVKYTTKNPDQLEKQLLGAAIKNGKEKAMKVAKNSNKFWVGRMVSLNILSDNKENTDNLQSNTEIELTNTASMVFEIR